MREIKWDWDKWFGDDNVQAMDWDAKGMHHHLIGLSMQQEPPGSLPDDMAAIRRRLGSPSDELWRRVQPQIFAAWTKRDGRWFQKGTAEACQQQLVRNERGRLGAQAKQALSRQQAEIPTLSSKGFVVPTLEEVKSYCKERKSRIKPEAFWNFYQSNGWKIGRSQMKSWHHAIVTWEQREGLGPIAEKPAKEALTECWGHKNLMIPVSQANKFGGHCSAKCREDNRARLEAQRAEARV